MTANRTVFCRCVQQVDMIAHQYPGLNGHGVFSGIRLKPVDIGLHIFIATETNLTVIASLIQVNGDIGGRDAG